MNLASQHLTCGVDDMSLGPDNTGVLVLRGPKWQNFDSMPFFSKNIFDKKCDNCIKLSRIHEIGEVYILGESFCSAITHRVEDMSQGLDNTGVGFSRG